MCTLAHYLEKYKRSLNNIKWVTYSTYQGIHQNMTIFQTSMDPGFPSPKSFPACSPQEQNLGAVWIQNPTGIRWYKTRCPSTSGCWFQPDMYVYILHIHMYIYKYIVDYYGQNERHIPNHHSARHVHGIFSPNYFKSMLGFCVVLQ